MMEGDSTRFVLKPTLKVPRFLIFLAKNVLMDRTKKIPKQMNEKTKNKYLSILEGKQEFLPIINKKHTKVTIPIKRPTLIFILQTKSEFDRYSAEPIETRSSRDNKRTKKSIKRKLNYSAACKIYIDPNGRLK